MEDRKAVEIEDIELIVPKKIKLSELRKKLMGEYLDVEIEKYKNQIIISFNEDSCEIDIKNNLITYVEFDDDSILEQYFNLLRIGETIIEQDIYIL